MSCQAFTDRDESGWSLAERLRGVPLRNPLVLAIPRGGIEVGASLARGVGAELDVALVRRVRSDTDPDADEGAFSEDGEFHSCARVALGSNAALERGANNHLWELNQLHRWKAIYRAIRPQAPMTGRTVILTDDGACTGTTMFAAAHSTLARRPHEVIIALPVASRDCAECLSTVCDRFLCLKCPADRARIGDYYREFLPVHEARVIALLSDFTLDEGPTTFE